MPPPKKIDLIPRELKRQLRELLADRGYGDIVDITAELNGWLAEENIALTIGKTAVGKYAQLLKDQADAIEVAEELMSEMGIEEEASMHKAIMQMIAAQAVQLMMKTREADGHLPAKDLMNLGRMLKDLMGSAGIREKMLADELDRLKREAREAVAEEVVEIVQVEGLSAEAAAKVRREILGVPG